MMMEYLTIGQLAKQSGLGRSTLLYYERCGLLNPSTRSMGNYRLYDSESLQRLEQVKLYRAMGLPIKKIAKMLAAGSSRRPKESVAILQKHLTHIGSQIDQLRRQQSDILRLVDQLQPTPPKRKCDVAARARSTRRKSVPLTEQENSMITKERWTEIMGAAGLSDDDMRNWHKQFEKLEPEAHQEFLESLGIQAAEIATIRKWSSE